MRNKKHLEKEKQNKMNIPEWLFKKEQAPGRKKIQKIDNAKTLKQLSRENINITEKNLDKELAKTMINPDYFIDENVKVDFKNSLESHNINDAISVLKIIFNFLVIGIETRYINKIVKKMATIYARLINEYKFLSHLLFSASFYKIIEEDQRIDETELFINLNINQNSTYIDKIDIKTQLEHQFKFKKQRNQVGYLEKLNQWNYDFIKLEN